MRCEQCQCMRPYLCSRCYNVQRVQWATRVIPPHVLRTGGRVRLCVLAGLPVRKSSEWIEVVW